MALPFRWVSIPVNAVQLSEAVPGASAKLRHRVCGFTTTYQHRKSAKICALLSIPTSLAMIIR